MADHGRKLAVVTGASSGIGRETALLLAARGWDVVATGRNPDRCGEAEAALNAAATGGARVTFVRGDFSEMADVKRMAHDIRAVAPRIDVLINNAGGVRDRFALTSEGVETTFAVNHLAPFLLTRELLPLLKRSAADAAPGTVRIIAVSSSGHAGCAAMNWDDLNMAGGFTTAGAYCQAKLANLLFTRELARRVAADGIVAQAMHPGRVDSNFASHGDEAMQSYMAKADNVTPDMPARTLLWMASEAEAGHDPGRYFHDMAEEIPSPQALDDAAAERLWRESEAILARIGI